MLKAFRYQLKCLSRDPQDPFTQKIRSLVGPRRATDFETPLRQMILAIPDMTQQIRDWTDNTEHPWAIRRLHNFVLAYLYNPNDFLPEKTEGLFGYLDDAYLVASVFQRTVDQLQLHPESLTPRAAALCELVPLWLQRTPQVLPAMTAKIDAVLGRLESASRMNTSVSPAASSGRGVE